MNAAEVVKTDVKHGGIFQVRQRLAERISQARKSAKVHPHGQVVAFDVRRRNPLEIRSADFDVWDRCHNLAAAIPPVASSAAVDFAKLGKVHVLPKVFAHGSDIGVVLVAGDLITAISTRSQVGNERMGIDAAAPADVVGDDELGFRVQGKPKHGATPFRRIRGIQMRVAGMDELPHLVNLHVIGADIADSGVKYPASFVRCRFHQFQNRVLVQSGEARDRANRHAFQHHRQGFCRNVGRGVVVPELRFILGKGNFAGGAAVSLDSALAVVSELADGVIAAFARHGLFPLAFSLRKAQNQFEGTEIGLPGFCLAPQPVSAGSGALTVSGLWWFDADFQREPAASELESDTPHRCISFLKRSALAARGVSHLLPNSSPSKATAKAAVESFNSYGLPFSRIHPLISVLLAFNRLYLASLFEPSKNAVYCCERISARKAIVKGFQLCSHVFRRESVRFILEQLANRICQSHLAQPFIARWKRRRLKPELVLLGIEQRIQPVKRRAQRSGFPVNVAALLYQFFEFLNRLVAYSTEVHEVNYAHRG